MVSSKLKDDFITIIANSAERDRDIDVSRAERAKQRAERVLEENKNVSWKKQQNLIVMMMFNVLRLTLRRST